MNERRLARLANQIKQRLAVVLQRELADPKLGLVTITRIELDKEFTQCKAYWSVLAPTGKEQIARRESAEVLDRARGFCQREVGKVLHTRTIPHLEFRFDEGIGGAVRMRNLLKELNPGGEQPSGDGGDGDNPAPDADGADRPDSPAGE
ncbi:MAG: 30S ribosome-binding factor RbfA [Planctomycetes bacterium]|nr:30S ribosome-binding factor RbfA [Planctomycetota bacterium]